MSANNISTLSSWVSIATVVATAPTIINLNIDAARNATSIGNYKIYEQPYRSGRLLENYSHTSELYVLTPNTEKMIDKISREMQSRVQSLKRSFSKYSDGFPTEKQSYFAYMADALCKLDFIDNVSSYNKYDSSIDTIIKLKNGLTLSVSCFIEDKKDAPMVFSIHRNHTLLVSDELPINEIVNTINSANA